MAEGPYRQVGERVADSVPRARGICVEICGDCGTALRSYADTVSRTIGKPGPCAHCSHVVVGAPSNLPPLVT